MTHIVRVPAFLLAAILVLAGCAELPGSGSAGAPSCPACAECPACAAPAKTAATLYEKVDYADVPGWSAASVAPGLRAFVAGCHRLAAAGALRRACEAARTPAAGSEESARRFVEETFDVWSVAGAASGLVTGYYEPVIAGSRTRSERFRHPIHGVPDDLVAVDLESVAPELKGLRLRGRLEGARLVPYWSRGEIEGGRGSRAPVLAWAEDAVELFFLQIQGSGQLALPSGERLRLGYGDHNGHPYRSLGRALIQRGELALEQTSMQGLKTWAAANPQKLREALNANPSYVFFREMKGAGADEGPVGTLGVPLTAGYSIAVDARQIPLGAPVFLSTTYPLSTQPLERLVAAQDTGGAIRGAVRADFYWGSGAEAGTQAGRMRQPGRMWILWPRGEPLPKL